MGFDDVRFPMRLARGASGGPERRVEVVTLASGAEQRGAVWAGSRRRWDVGSAVTKLEDLAVLTAFFEARGGRLRGFRFADVSDDRSGATGAEPGVMDQALGIGDGATVRFELMKDYGGARRRIRWPIEGSIVVAVDDAATGAFSVDDGAVVFDAPPALGAAVTAGFKFDCAARFDTDRLEVSVEAFGAGRIISVPIVEVTHAAD